MRRSLRGQRIGDWLMLIGAAGLFGSLFLTWSHQLPPDLRTTLAESPAISSVVPDPTAWQVYSAADVLLALLAAVLAGMALRGRGRWSRVTTLAGVGLALAFTLHADAVAPTSGLVIVDPNHPPAYVPHAASSGPGEIVAIVALGIAAAGLMLSLISRRQA